MWRGTVKHVAVILCLTLVCLGTVRTAAAQDLAITNVRVITGAGPVIEQGSIVVRGGRIASIAAGNTAAPGVKVIDGRGLTAAAGFIDAHRHIVTGTDPAGWLARDASKQMRELLEAGYTTLLSGWRPGGTDC